MNKFIAYAFCLCNIVMLQKIDAMNFQEQMQAANQAMLENNFISAVTQLEQAIQTPNITSDQKKSVIHGLHALYCKQGSYVLAYTPQTPETAQIALESFQNARTCAQELENGAYPRSENYYATELLVGRAHEALVKLGIQPTINSSDAEMCYLEAARHTNLVEAKFRLGCSLSAFLKNQKLDQNSLVTGLNQRVAQDIEQNLTAVVTTPKTPVEFVANSHFYLGILYLSQNKKEQAKSSFLAAANMGHYAAMHNCGEIALEESNGQAALQFFTAAAPYFRPSGSALVRLKRTTALRTAEQTQTITQKRGRSLVDGAIINEEDLLEQEQAKIARA